MSMTRLKVKDRDDAVVAVAVAGGLGLTRMMAPASPINGDVCFATAEEVRRLDRCADD